jgi:pimeloyl-ACP methyl ester carboxylesterase
VTLVAVLWTGVLALGVLLVVTGFLWLSAGLPRWGRLIGAPVTAVVVALGVYVVAVPVWVTTAPRPASGAATPSDVGLGYEDVTITTEGGEGLAGWYVPSSNGAAVVVLHGSGSDRSAVLQHVAVLARHGYGVLALDARGHGASSGRPMLWGWYGEVDVPRAAAYLAARPDVDPGRVGVVGLSMGGEEAIGAAARTSDIRAVVAEGVTGRTADDLHWLSDAYGWRGAVTLTVHEAQTALAEAISPARRPPALEDSVRATAPRPILLLAAGQVPDEQHAAATLRAAAPDTVQVWVVLGAGHTGALREDRASWESRVVGFLDAALLRGPSPDR